MVFRNTSQAGYHVEFLPPCGLSCNPCFPPSGVAPPLSCNQLPNPRSPSRLEDSRGVKCGDVVILYKMIWQDVREAVEYIHKVPASCALVV